METQFAEAVDAGSESGAKISALQATLRDEADLQTIVQQESQVQTALADLKERRKRFADCNVESTLRARQEIMDRIKEMFEQTQNKFQSNKANVAGLLTLDSTKPARKAVLQEV